ncbi:sporulation protein YunB [Pseudoflavonifractor phocaeensis]|uniref:sporulation protein YunB n=1 Tax=Pseudoflavonifractor phocaeensis TaxID=1870988 RepID=UPI0021088332|nr:sporulation protein YunB [Pseudoflavonifractor phocaeensis]MCQ4864193.1 sporulation protein YunB [Pseudoflavonifractor phocaeensis]
MTRRPMRRVWLRGPGLRARSGRGLSGGAVQLMLSAVLGIGLALALIRAFDSSVRPMVTEMARTQVSNAVTRIVDTAVTDTLAEEAIAYSDMVTLQTDSAGRITALTSNSTEMNRLRTDIMNDIVSQVDSLGTPELGVPLGNLTGFSSLSGKGPLLPVRVLTLGTPEAAFSNVFTDAGINQTYHRVMLDVTVDITLLIPGGTVNTSVNTQVCVAETVLVGEVPQTYLQLTPAG